VRAGGGADTAATAFGSGSPGHLAAKLLYRHYQAAQVDFVSPTPSGGAAATEDLTFAGAPTAANTVRTTICGRVIDTAWLVGETPDQIRDKVIADITEQDDDLPVTAASGGVGIVTATFKVAGPWGNDATILVELLEGQTGTETAAWGGAGKLSGGTTEPDFSTALSNLQGTEYHLFVPCVSNADAEAGGASTNAGRTKTHIETYQSGLDAKLQQAVVGLTGTIANSKVGAVLLNAEEMEYVLAVNGQSLPCEWAGAEAGDRIAQESLDPAANRIGRRLYGTYGSADVLADKPTLAESEDALGNGVSIVTYNSSDEPIIARPITTHSQTAGGGPDRRVLDTSGVTGVYVVVRDVREALPAEFPGAKITPDIQAGDDPPPPGVIEERDVKTFLIARLRFWARSGVIRDDKVTEAIDDGSLIVQVNASDPTQVDIVIPMTVFSPLAKFGVVAQKLVA
jgi:phage tail sheath gpL-like